MKKFLLVFCLFGIQQLSAQKYVLLDQRISMPVKYSNTITAADKFKGYFPVEKKDINVFIKALEEISAQLSGNNLSEKAKQYEIGCVKFIGYIISLEKGKRVDYVITSDCENLKIVMHLCDVKLSNTDNAYFINTWIKYIKSGLK
jgi:hypothetical protein